MADETIFHTVWLLLRDKEFLSHHAAISPNVFPRGSMRWLVSQSLKSWKGRHKRLTAATVALLAESDAPGLQRNQTTAEQVCRAYDDLCNAYAVPQEGREEARELCREWLERRTMGLALERAGNAVEQGDVNAARAILDMTRPAAVDDQPQLVLSAGTADFLQTVREPKPGAIPFGLEELDRLWEGGHRGGELGIIAGSTGIGKSMSLAFLAQSAYWAGATVMYYTFELTVEQIKERIALAMLAKGKRDVHGEWADELARRARILGKKTPPPGIIDIRGGTKSLPDLAADLDEFKRVNGAYPDLLLLDSLDDLAPLDKQKAGWEQLKEAYTWARKLALKNNIHIWTATQLTRDAVEKARVSLKQIGEAYAKAQRAHYVIGLAQTPEDKQHEDGPKIHLYVLKDSLHGTVGAWLELSAAYGNGDNGYAGYEVDYTHGLPV